MVPGGWGGPTGLLKHLTDREACGMCEQAEGRVSSRDAPGPCCTLRRHGGARTLPLIYTSVARGIRSYDVSLRTWKRG